jgi:hypothetical protein
LGDTIVEYRCPLCGQPVSVSLYQKITGIWGERQRQLKKIKEERAKLTKRMKEQREKLNRQLKAQAAKFRREQRRAIKQAVGNQTKRFKLQLAALRRKEKQVEERAQKRIERITEQARTKAKNQFNLWKNNFRSQIRGQIKTERDRAIAKERLKLSKAQRSVESAARRIQIKSRQLQEARREIRTLQDQLARHETPQSDGLLLEDILTKALMKEFPEDKGIKNTGKGGDILHPVICDGECAGLIVYECKKVKQYNSAHVKQAAKAKMTRKADFAVLVTSAMKRNTQGFFVEKGVIVIHPSGVLSLAGILRQQLAQISRLKLGQQERNEAIRLILQYMEGPQFANSMELIIEESIDLNKQLEEEKKKHEETWEKRSASYKKIHDEAKTVQDTSKTLLSGRAAEKAEQKETGKEIAPKNAKLSPRLKKILVESESAEASAES